ncbi:MAG TPA: flagellar biosynthetic protein FliR [Bryobacteraceae bacterium]|nr:flagellar biosynthetic protein FliR [Bryobacteraceae bacterium]
MDATLLLAFLLVLARVAGFFSFVPLPGGKNGPDAVRVVLALGFTLALYREWPAVAAPPALGWFVVTLAAEAALGIAVGLAVASLNEIFLMAAQIAGLQAGYGYASTIDPATQADATVLLVLAELIAGLMFFALGLDREILRIFATSLTSYPPGSFRVSGPAAMALVKLSAGIFSAGLRLALPVVALLALVDIALALLGRLHAQLQLVALAFPAKMMTALAMLAALAVLYPRIYAAGARETLRVVSRMAGN